MGGTYTLGADGMYLELLLAGKLTAYLNEVDNAAREQAELLARQMAAEQGVTESLKAANQMAWVSAMNQIKHSAEKIVYRDCFASNCGALFLNI